MTNEQIQYRRSLLPISPKPKLDVMLGFKETLRETIDRKPTELVVMIGEHMEYARIEIPDFDYQPFEARVKLKEAIVKNHIEQIKKVLGDRKVSFVIIAASKMNQYESI